MKKHKVLGMCMGVCVGAAIGFTIDSMIKRRKLNKAFDDAIDKKDLEEAIKIVKEVETIDNNVDTALKIAIGVVSLRFACAIVKSIHSNREFNEINYVSLVLHIISTDDTLSNSYKVNIVNEIIDSGKFGKKAISLLKEHIIEEE